MVYIKIQMSLDVKLAICKEHAILKKKKLRWDTSQFTENSKKVEWKPFENPSLTLMPYYFNFNLLEIELLGDINLLWNLSLNRNLVIPNAHLFFFKCFAFFANFECCTYLRKLFLCMHDVVVFVSWRKVWKKWRKDANETGDLESLALFVFSFTETGWNTTGAIEFPQGGMVRNVKSVKRNSPSTRNLWKFRIQ